MSELPKNSESIQIDLKNILPSLAKNLYGDDWRVSIRELLQNAHDAISERVARAELKTPEIKVVLNTEASTISFEDNGIGMTFTEVKEYLATVGYGRKREQIEALKLQNTGDREALQKIIGQYGIGFLSSFIIAENVEVLTKSALDENAPATRAVFTGETKWYHEATTRSTAGTTVIVRLKKEAVTDPDDGKVKNLKELLNFTRLESEIRRFGDLLPFPIMVCRYPGDRTPTIANTTIGAWEKDSCRKDDLELFLKNRRKGENAPVLVERFSFLPTQEHPISAHGIIYFPRPAQSLRADFESVSRVDLFCRRMFITDDIAGLLPEWAKFACAVVECPNLSPTLSRNDVVRHDAAFVALKQRLAQKITETLIQLAERQPQDFYGFLKEHEKRLTTGMLESWHTAKGGTERQSFFGSFIKFMPFYVVDRSRPQGEMMTIPRYLKSVAPADGGNAKPTLYYLKDHTLWGQFRSMIMQKDVPVMVPSDHAGPALINAYGQTFPDEAFVEDIRSSFEELYVDKVDQAPYQQLMEFLRSLDGGGPDVVTVSKFAPSYVPAIMTIGDAEDRTAQSSALDNFLQQAANVLDPQTRKSLQEISQRSKEGKVQVVVTMNASNGVIQKLKEHCQSGRPLSGVAADILHEVYHNARAVSDPNAAVSDHYFEHRNSLLSRLMDLERDNTDLEKNLSNARVKISTLEKTESAMNKDFEQRVCALLLTDLRGSTRMVGFLDKLESARILRDYANEMKRIIEEHGGRVDRFTGDGIFAYFWSPELNPERVANNANVCAAQINISTGAFFGRAEVKSALMDQAAIEIVGSRTALHYGAVNFGNIAGSPTLVGPNVVVLFRVLEQKKLLERCPVILTGGFVTAAQLGPQLQPVERNLEIDASLPRQTLYPHPNWSVKND